VSRLSLYPSRQAGWLPLRGPRTPDVFFPETLITKKFHSPIFLSMRCQYRLTKSS
jgi:hypothetical protein